MSKQQTGKGKGKTAKEKGKQYILPAVDYKGQPTSSPSISQFLTPANFCILDLDKDPADLLQNLKDCIGLHRFWTYVNTDKRYRSPEGSLSWKVPKRGTFLRYVKYKGRWICLVGIASQSWMKGVISKNGVAEFRDKKMYTKVHTSRPTFEKRHYSPVVITSRKYNTKLGPDSTMRAFDSVYNELSKTGPCVDLTEAFTVFIVHLWDPIRNDDVKNLVLESFDPYVYGRILGPGPVGMMKKWERCSIRAIEKIEKNIPYKVQLGTKPTSAPEVLQIVRVLHREGQDSSSFDTDMMPIKLNGVDELQYKDQEHGHLGPKGGEGGNGSELQTRKYPDWVLSDCCCSELTDQQQKCADDEPKRVIVKLIQRVDIQAISKNSVGAISLEEAAVSAPRLINSQKIEFFGSQLKLTRDRQTDDVFQVIDGLMFKDGFLFTRVALNCSIYLGILPMETELIKLSTNPSSESSADDLDWASSIFGCKKWNLPSDPAIGTLSSKEKCSKASSLKASTSTENYDDDDRGFNLHDLVNFGCNDFGVVVYVEKYGFKGNQSVVKHLCMGVLSISNESATENNEIFCAQCGSCENIKKRRELASSEENPVPMFSESPSTLSDEQYEQRDNGRPPYMSTREQLFSIGQIQRIREGALICRVVRMFRNDVTVKLVSLMNILTVQAEFLSVPTKRGDNSSIDPSGSQDIPFFGFSSAKVENANFKRTERSCPVKEEELSSDDLEDFVKDRYSNRVRYARYGGSTQRCDENFVMEGADGTLKEPTVWRVKIMVGRHRVSAKWLSASCKRLWICKNSIPKVPTTSAFSIDLVRGFVFAEAEACGVTEKLSDSTGVAVKEAKFSQKATPARGSDRHEG